MRYETQKLVNQSYYLYFGMGLSIYQYCETFLQSTNSSLSLQAELFSHKKNHAINIPCVLFQQRDNQKMQRKLVCLCLNWYGSFLFESTYVIIEIRPFCNDCAMQFFANQQRTLNAYFLSICFTCPLHRPQEPHFRLKFSPCLTKNIFTIPLLLVRLPLLWC